MTRLVLELYHSVVNGMADELVHLAVRVTRDRHLAEDACQEAYAELYKAVTRRSDILNHREWLRRVVVNKALAVARTRAGPDGSARLSLDAQGSPPPEETDDSITSDTDRIDLEEALKHLPPEQQEALALRVFHGLSCRDIAERLECSERTVQRRISAAVVRLHRTLGGE
jgi:RNA polymerase sigma-70 factor (ECF subfamily)